MTNQFCITNIAFQSPQLMNTGGVMALLYYYGERVGVGETFSGTYMYEE